MKRIVLTFGLISGAALSAMMAVSITYFSHAGTDQGVVVGYATMVLAFVMIYFGVRSYRDNVAGGAISFGRAFNVGILIMILASACYVATWEVIYFKFMPNFAEKYATQQIEKAKAAGASAPQLAEQTKSMEKFKEMYSNPLVNIALTFLEPLPVGLLFTLASAAALRRTGNAVGR